MEQQTGKKSGFFREILQTLIPSLREFRTNDPLRMAGATAFFTTFALPPIIFIIIHIFGIFFSRRSVGRAIIDRVTNTLGEDGAGQVRQVLRSIRGFGESWYVILIGFIFLLCVKEELQASRIRSSIMLSQLLSISYYLLSRLLFSNF